ncbi:glycosyl transferase, partial [Burkholderia stagnalis]
MSNSPIKIFVGCDPNNCDLEQMMVLDYSVRKHTKHPVEI